MTALFDDFELFGRQVGRLEAAVEQSKGAYKELMRRLKKEFKTDDVKKAKALLEAMRQEELKRTEAYIKERIVYTEHLKKIKKRMEKCQAPAEVITLLSDLISSTPKPMRHERKRRLS